MDILEETDTVLLPGNKNIGVAAMGAVVLISEK
jgi:hypothetical protein